MVSFFSGLSLSFFSTAVEASVSEGVVASWVTVVDVVVGCLAVSAETEEF